MPTKVKITERQILSATVEVLRKFGEKGLNARAIAKELNVSTQPIYSAFGSMKGLLSALQTEAEARYAHWISEYMGKTLPSDYKAFGMGFIRFSAEEKELFRFLFIKPKGSQTGKEPQTTHNLAVEKLSQLYGIETEVARKFHEGMSLFCFGLALLINFGVADYDEAEVSEKLSQEFKALYGYFVGQNKR